MMASAGSTSSQQKPELSGLNEMEIGGRLPDVKLVVEDCELNAHKAVLAAYSPYFRTMFNTEMKEKHADVIELYGFSAIGFKHVLNFMYTSWVNLNVENMQDILSAANHLQIHPVLKSCCDFMQTEVNIQNCIEIRDIATFYSLSKVEDYIFNFILTHFTQFVCTDEFLRLSEDYVCRLLSSNKCQGHEIDLFRAANRWVTHDTARLDNVFHIMQNIRFELISPKDIRHTVQSVNYMQENVDCVMLLWKPFGYHSFPHQQPLLSSPGMCVRSETPCLVALGRTNSECNKIQICNRETGKWMQLGETIVPAYRCCVAVLNDFLFVVGVFDLLCENLATANMLRYDPRSNTWLKLASMLEPRTDFAVSVIDGFLYAVAGENNTGMLSSAERYKVEDNEWEPIANFPLPTIYHAAASCDGKLYVSGGYSSLSPQKLYSKKLYSHEPNATTWESKPEMKTERTRHCMVAYKERLYCIGGMFEGRDLLTTILSSNEMFDINAEQWTDIAPHFAGQSGAGAALVENKIYVVGGKTWLEGGEVVRTVTCYDLDRDVWEKVADFPEAMKMMACCALRIPGTLV